MKDNLTLDAVAIGSLAVCLGLLAATWVLEWFRRRLRQPRMGTAERFRVHDIEAGRARGGQYG